MSVEVLPLTGSAAASVIPAVARLRVAVFREWPYLYDGSEAYERAYLARYSESSRAIIVAARDGEDIIGAATGMPLADHAEEFAAPFVRRGMDVASVFYCSESVLLSTYRGQGLGHAFFDAREAHARALGFQWSAFCAVDRPNNHPAKPADYRPLDAFWRKRGYKLQDDMITTFAWKDIDQSGETDKIMRTWLRAL